MLRGPYLPDVSEMDQLQKIFQALGTPNDDNWPVSIYEDISIYVYSSHVLISQLYVIVEIMVAKP